MKKILPYILAAGIFLFPQKTNENYFLNTNIKHPFVKKIDYHSLEGLITINSIQEENNNVKFLDSLKNKPELQEKIDSLTFKDISELKKMVKKYSGKYIPWKNYSEGVYKKYVAINDSIISIKKKFPLYDLFFYRGKFYFESENQQSDNFFKDITKLNEILRIVNDPEPSDAKKNVYLGFSRLFPYIPLIKNNSLNKEDFIQNLSLVVNESNGFSYITGHSGDINLFQINPIIVPGIYREIKKSLKNTELVKIVKSMKLNEFQNALKEDPKISLLSGIWLFENLKKNSKTESQAVLSYMVGPGGYLNLPKELTDRIEKNKITKKEDIKEEELKNKETNYLYRYYRKKEIYKNLVEFIKN